MMELYERKRTIHDLRSGLVLPSHLQSLGAPTVWENGWPEKRAIRCAQNFDAFIQRMETDNELESCFRDLAKDWREIEENRQLYGGFFKNYYRNREDVEGYDDKIVWQASSDFLDYFEIALQLLGHRNSPIRDLILEAQHLLRMGEHAMAPVIEELAQKHPELRDRLMPLSREMPITVRFMRYRGRPGRATVPHVDKTVLSTIFWSSDPVAQQRLSFVQKTQGSVEDGLYQPISAVGCNDCPAYTFWGAALSEAGFDQVATPHAVEPVAKENYRYSIAVFWLLPEFDMAYFNTAVSEEPKELQFKSAA